MQTLRQRHAWLHRWAGVIAGWVLYVVFVTGSVSYFRVEIDRWMQPERPLVFDQRPTAELAQSAFRWLAVNKPDALRWVVTMPNARDPARLVASWQSAAAPPGGGRASGSQPIDPSGHEIHARETAGAALIYRIHYQLHHVPAAIGQWLVGMATLLGLVALMTGLIIHGHLFRNPFVLRLNQGRRTWLDAHKLIGVVTIPYQAMITYSGLVLLASTLMAPVVSSLSEASRGESRAADLAPAPASVRSQLLDHLPSVVAVAEQLWGEGQVRYISVAFRRDGTPLVVVAKARTSLARSSETAVYELSSGRMLPATSSQAGAAVQFQDALLGLHEAQFASPWMRWMFFSFGIGGAFLIASGLTLWTGRMQDGPGPGSTGSAILKRTNIGMLWGVPLALTAYLLSNRLLPAGLEGRAAAETAVLFAALAMAILYAAARPSSVTPRHFAVALCGLGLLLPLVDAAAAGNGPLTAVFAGQWSTLTVDIVMLAMSAICGCLAVRMNAPGERRGGRSPRRGKAAPPDAL